MDRELGPGTTDLDPDKTARAAERAKLQMLAREREGQAVRLRTAGASFTEIARQLGYANPSGAQKAVKRAMRQFLREPTKELIDVEIARLDEMQMYLWPRVQRGDVAAINTVLNIMRRRAEMLGVDAPKRIDITGQIRRMAEDMGLDPEAAIAAAEQVIAEAGL